MEPVGKILHNVWMSSRAGRAGHNVLHPGGHQVSRPKRGGNHRDVKVSQYHGSCIR